MRMRFPSNFSQIATQSIFMYLIVCAPITHRAYLPNVKFGIFLSTTRHGREVGREYLERKV